MVGKPGRQNAILSRMSNAVKKIALSLFVVAASGAYVWSQSGQQPAGDLLGSMEPADALQTGSITPVVPTSAAAKPVTTRLLPLVTRETVPAPSTPALPAPAASPASEPQAQASSPVSQPVAAPQPPTTTALSFANAPALPAAPPPAPEPAAATVADVPLPRLRPQYTPPPAPANPPLAPIRIAATAPARTGMPDGSYTGPSVNAYYGHVQVQAIVQGGRLVAIKMLDYPSDRRTSLYINRQALPMLRDEVISAQSANVDIISGATLTSEAFIRSLGSALQKAVRS
jgi:uncharacterized protein with FMN-binding domain